MDTRPPDSKRIRADPSPWPTNDSQGPRIPGGHPFSQATLPRPQQPRRPSEVQHQQHYEPDARRLSQTALYDSYGAPGPRDPAIKPDPTDRPPLPNSRPHSTGHLNEGRPKPPPGDLRVQGMAPYDHPPAPPQGQPHYIGPGPPQSPLHPPPPGQYGFEVNIYEQNSAERTQEPIYAEYTGVASSSQKKRTPRTSQACEACRNAKAKCTDPKPCQGCQEKGIHCKYDPPAPKQTDRIQSDMLNRLDDLLNNMDQMRNDMISNVEQSRKRDIKIKNWMKTETRKRRQVEKALITLMPALSTVFDQSDDEMEGMKEEEEDEDLCNDVKRPPKRRSVRPNGVNSSQPDMELDGEADDDSDNASETEPATNVPPGEPAIPIGHTTGAAKILQWPAVAAMVGDKMKKDRNRGLDPLRREIKRGVIRLYSRGEGVEKSMGHDKDSVSDYSLEPPRSSSDTYSEAAHSPAVDHPWSQGGAASPVAESYLSRAEIEAGAAAIDLTGVMRLDEATVKHLAGSYMVHLNVMHPIITQKSLEVMITHFLQQIGEPVREVPPHDFSTFVGADSVGAKRKRSPTITAIEHPYAQQLNAERRPRTISEAIVLLILALGKICEYRHKIPDVVPSNDVSTSNSPSNTFSPQPVQQSPQLSSHSSTLPSPTMQDRPRNRRASLDGSGSYPKYPPLTRNMDVIPGLAYFAIATDILGNHTGGTGLPYVHACLLAGLYHSQLGRVLQSHAFVKEAGYALTFMLKQHLARYKKMQEDMSDPERHANVKWYPEDNRILFTFWTCLQLESDIVAELEVPQSDILSLESIMPWPNLTMAFENKEMTEKEMRCYSVQLLFRKNLNVIHRELYGPGKENEYRLADMNKLAKFPYINTMIEDLNSVMNANQSLAWRDGDLPSNDILEARLRAKMYGAQVITYRHFLRMVLNNRYDGTGVPNDEISAPIMEFARRCIVAMFHSAMAFWGMGTRRLVVTNVWGTSHAQWGHVIVLHAAYMHPKLQRHVPAPQLCELTRRVRDFLVSVAHPSSALADDIRILNYAEERSGAREAAAAMGWVPGVGMGMNMGMSVGMGMGMGGMVGVGGGGMGPVVGGGSFGSLSNGSGEEMGRA